MSFGKYGVLLAMTLLSGGCYVYSPVRPSDAALDAKVRATVTAEQAAELSPGLRNVTPQVSGVVVGRDDRQLLLDVPLYTSAPGLSRRPVHNRVGIPLDDVISLEVRKLSRGRTAATVGALALAVTAGFTLASDDKGSEEKPGQGTDNAIRIRIPIGIFR